MKTENLVLLPLTVYGTPSGNYDGSSTSFDGDRQKGVGYYVRRSSTQSIRFQLADLVGTITIQGTLDADPQTDSQWFDVYEYSNGSTIDFSQAVIGNFTWLRAHVTGFTSGTITAVTLTY